MSNTAPIRLTNTSFIRFLSLVYQPAGATKIYLGNEQTQRFVVVDSYWKPITELLTRPMKVYEIATLMSAQNPKDFPRDKAISKVKLLILLLTQHHLVYSIDGHVLAVQKVKTTRVSVLIGKTMARRLLNPFAIGIAVFLSVFAFIAPVAFTNLRPVSSDFFWDSHMSLNVLTYFFASWLILYQHELGHVLAARAFGVTSFLRLSHRLHFLVVETDFDDIYKASPKQRVAIFAAGTLIDLMTIGVGYLILIAYPLLLAVFPSVLFQFLRQLILLEWFTIVWQLFFFMKTDVYFIVKELVRIENLYSLAISELKTWFLRRPSQTADVSARTRSIVRLYAFIVLIGSAIAIGRYVLYNLPITMTLIVESVRGISQGFARQNVFQMLDGGIVLAFEALFFYLLIRAFFSDKHKGMRKWL